MIKHIKVKAPPPSLSITMTERVIGGLLLTPENASQDAPFTAVEVVPLFCTEDLRERRFTEDKLKQATKCLNPNKAPGWDSVPPAVIKSIGTHDRSGKNANILKHHAGVWGDTSKAENRTSHLD